MGGLTNNYLVYEVNSKMLEDPDILNEFKMVNYGIDDFDIGELLLKVLSEGGIVYGVKEDKTLKAVFIFEKVIKKKKNKKEQNDLVFLNAYFTEDLSRAISGFVNIIEENLREKLTTKEISSVKWNGRKIVGGNYVFLRESISSFLACFSLGFSLGIIFDKMLLGLILGTVVGIFLGAIVRITK